MVVVWFVPTFSESILVTYRHESDMSRVTLGFSFFFLQFFLWGIFPRIDFITAKRMRRSASWLSATKIVHMEMGYWDRYVEVEFAMAGFITFCKMMSVKPEVRTVSLWTISIGHCSIQPVFRDDVPLNSISFQRFSSFWTHQGRFRLSYIEANVCPWPNLLANTRHHRRH